MLVPKGEATLLFYREVCEVREDRAYASKFSLFFVVFALFAPFALKCKRILSL